MVTKTRPRGEEIRHFILRHVAEHPKGIGKLTAAHFGITRQAVNKHLQKLTAESALEARGRTRNREYQLRRKDNWTRVYRLGAKLAEDVVWRQDVRPVLGQLPENVVDIWTYGFTEMFNNAIDHSEGALVTVSIERTAQETAVLIKDDGVGIFHKIKEKLNLLDERHAILELAKGKLTTDPRRHTGEGIFFTSRMFDMFNIMSRGVHFAHEFGDPEDWIMESENSDTGTVVQMRLNNHTARTTSEVFNEFTVGDDFGFNKTVVPVELARYGNEKLISRSQAKRLMARFELFKTVVLNFQGVETIGQAFADELFRVFPQAHPETSLVAIRATEPVQRMIARARGILGQ